MIHECKDLEGIWTFLPDYLPTMVRVKNFIKSTFNFTTLKSNYGEPVTINYRQNRYMPLTSKAWICGPAG